MADNCKRVFAASGPTKILLAQQSFYLHESGGWRNVF